MREFFIDFLKILANSILIIALAFVSFLFIVNIYHYEEVSYQYDVSISTSEKYQNYKKLLNSVDKKMNSVDLNNTNYNTTAKPIYEYYKGCKKIFDEDSFNKLQDGMKINVVDIYNANTKILNDYNNSCLFSLPYNISMMYEDSNVFDEVRELTEEKREIIVSNAEYLTKATLGNSSYSFSTNTFRASIYNQTASWYDLTINNYKMMASILDDIADWYVLEFGGNR